MRTMGFELFLLWHALNEATGERMFLDFLPVRERKVDWGAEEEKEEKEEEEDVKEEER